MQWSTRMRSGCSDRPVCSQEIVIDPYGVRMKWSTRMGSGWQNDLYWLPVDHPERSSGSKSWQKNSCWWYKYLPLRCLQLLISCRLHAWPAGVFFYLVSTAADVLRTAFLNHICVCLLVVCSCSSPENRTKGHRWCTTVMFVCLCCFVSAAFMEITSVMSLKSVNFRWFLAGDFCVRFSFSDDIVVCVWHVLLSCGTLNWTCVCVCFCKSHQGGF